MHLIFHPFPFLPKLNLLLHFPFWSYSCILPLEQHAPAECKKRKGPHADNERPSLCLQGKPELFSQPDTPCYPMIMKNKDFFKPFLDFQLHISARYEQEARDFQLKYNASHPDCHIWRHMLYRRTFDFYHEGQHLSACIEVLRFRYAHTFRTFTFYGSLLCPFSHFSAGFIRQAIAEAGLLLSQTASLVSADTIRRWTLTMPSAAACYAAPA